MLIFPVEQYALTEASYTVAKLLQRFDVLENADTDPSPEPELLTNLTLSHAKGVSVKLYSSSDA